MVSRPGPSPILTQAQISTILAWNRRRHSFREACGSVAELSRFLRLPLRLTYKYLKACEEDGPKFRLANVQGRRRKATDAQQSCIGGWIAARRILLGGCTSVVALATILNVKPDRVYDCINREGHYPALLKRENSTKPTSSAKPVLSRASRSGVRRRRSAKRSSIGEDING